MASNGEIRIEGLEAVLRGLARTKPEVVDAAMKGVRRAGAEIIATAQENLRNNKSWVTGLLAQSGRVVDTRDQEGIKGVDIGFFARESMHGYAEYVEYGRPPGKMPPPDVLAEWFYKKHRVRDRRKARAMGWGLAVNIAAHGTKGKPFFQPAVDRHRLKIIEALTATVRKATQ